MRIVTFPMAGVRSFLIAIFGTPPDDVPPCVAQANSFREVVSLQALFVTLTSLWFAGRVRPVAASISRSIK
jgi:hypothetical protein